jgi:radical SAM protein with 4Fe4S-binding SPASM domain
VPFSYRRLRELNTREVFLILDQLKEEGCFYLGFTGGEPFLRKDIIEILCYAKKRGFQIIIYTNGSLINKKIADELKKINPNKVDITIPAMSKDAFERISRVAGSRDKVFRAIDLLHKKGIELGFKTCVLKPNESEIKDIQNFADSLGALHRLDSMLSPRLNGSKEPYKYRGKLKESLVASRKSSLDCARLGAEHELEHLGARRDRQVASKKEYKDCNLDSELRTTNYELFKCGVGRSQAAITPQGELKMCTMIDYPKYNVLGAGTNLKKEWKRLKRLVSGIKADKNYGCNTCKLKPYCKWCPAKGWLYNQDFYSCEPESRWRAEQIIRLTG